MKTFWLITELVRRFGIAASVTIIAGKLAGLAISNEKIVLTVGQERFLAFSLLCIISAAFLQHCMTPPRMGPKTTDAEINVYFNGDPNLYPAVVRGIKNSVDNNF